MVFVLVMMVLNKPQKFVIPMILMEIAAIQTVLAITVTISTLTISTQLLSRDIGAQINAAPSTDAETAMLPAMRNAMTGTD